MLDLYLIAVQQQIDLLQGQLEEVEEQIREAYQLFKQNPYYLHAILIHEGSGEGGHYYSYIFDRKAQQWYCFNDYRVSIVSED